MADATHAKATVDTAAPRTPRRTPKVLTRLVRAKWDDHELDCRARFTEIGELLHELRPQVPDKRWGAYVTKHFPFSTTSAWRYEKFFLAVERRRRPPKRLSDVERPRPSHQPPIYDDVRARMDRARAWSARIEADRKVHASQAQERKDILDAAHRIIATGYRIESKACHPDHGGSAAAFRIVTAARDKLRRCLAD